MADDPTLNELMQSCSRSALHLETRDCYMTDDPMYLAWRAGHRYDPDDRDSWWHPWNDLTTATAGRGVDLRRARVVSEPISDYIRFEYDVSFMNLASGEQIRWLPRREATSIPIPGNDFWLFDHEVVLVNHFSGNGDWTGTETIRQPDVVKLCATAFETIWEQGIPHADYHPA